MSSIPRSLAAAAVVLALTGCSVTTEYVPITPGRVTFGIDGSLGIYRNGTFTKLAAVDPSTFACTPPAVAVVQHAVENAASAQRNSMIANVTGALLWIFPPALAVSAIFAVRSVDAYGTSLAHAVDAINLYNDEAQCRGSTPGTGGAP